MKKLKWIISFIILLTFACKPAEKNDNSLETGFQTPPNQAKPYVWWHWINGCISKQGITNDLEAMAKQGIGGATIFSVQLDIERFRDYKPVYNFMTPEWRGMVRHAIQEADRLGMKILMHNCDGFGTSGGPWVKPEGAMKMVTFSRVNIMGPVSYKEQLPSPYTKNDFYREIAVVAFPVLSPRRGSMHDYAFEITSDAKVNNIKNMTDLFMNSHASINPIPKNKPVSFTISFKEPFNAAAFIIADNFNNQKQARSKYRLEYSIDGKIFNTILEFYSELSTQKRVDFPEFAAKHFRISILDFGQSEEGPSFTIPEIELLEKDGIPRMPKINDFEVKAGYWIRRRDQKPASPVPANWAIDREKMIFLSEKLDDQGVLTWDVPDGEWEVMRIGFTLTGHMNGPSTPAGRGLECDKLDAGFVEAFFNGMPKEIIEENKDLAGKSFTHILSDSWEAKCLNWTEILPEEFKTRRGYEIIPFLPVLCGEIVGSVDISERFLYDFRKTIVELIKENYYSKLTQLYNAHGIKYQAEASGAQQQFFDPISYPSVVDQPMTEFWVNPNTELPPASVNGDVMGAVAAAQLYNKGIVSAEAFTSGAGNWKQTPFNLKSAGDMAFALGINHLYFHSSTHQPDETYPGWQMGKWGICMNRKITWWEQSHAWLSYLARCQFMLQQGHFVGDILAFHGEGTPVSTYYAYQPDSIRFATADMNRLKTALTIAPTGYAWTGCNDENILSRLTVKDNKLMLPHGAGYQVLILPERTEMTPGLLKALKNLIMDGAVVYGPKPVKSPSLVNYPAADEEVNALASEIWGNIDGKNIVEHPFGKGKMVWGIPLKELLEKLNIAPDFEFISGSRETDIKYNHRRTEEADFYFISNQTRRTESVECFFRAGNKQPEIWYPDNGKMKLAGQYEVVDGRVKMPLQLDPYGSLFVVFREKSGNSITKLSYGDNASANAGQVWKENNSYVFTTSQEGNYVLHSNKGKTSEISIKNLPAPLLITGNWDVRFPEGWGAPAQADFHKLISWHNHPEEGIKYFSGTASYLKEIDIPAEMLSENYRISIDLGEVKDLAEVIVNGKNTGVLWKLPFSTDITSVLVPGKNKLEIKVTNVWANRLIGDQLNPQNKRFTEPMNTIHYDDPREQILRPSGLLGPVKISVSSISKLDI